MKHYRKVLDLNVPARIRFVNLPPRVRAALKESGILEGLCLVNAMNITSSVFINDNESGLHEDYARWLEKLAPFNPDPEYYHHNRTGEENGDAHLKRQIMGREVVVAVPTARSTSEHGSRFFTANSTGIAPSA
jgi:secondary thiamine-phosphate synthase enzyme